MWAKWPTLGVLQVATLQYNKRQGVLGTEWDLLAFRTPRCPLAVLILPSLVSFARSTLERLSSTVQYSSA